MARRLWQIAFTLAALFLTTAILSGCAKRAGSPGSMGTGETPMGQAGMGTAPGLPVRDGDHLLAELDRQRAASGTTLAGITIPALPSPAGFTETAALRDVHFEFDRYAIRPEDRPALEQSAYWLRTHPQALLLIEGHADERGTNEYNLALGERRAAATRDYLAALGIDRARINLLSYGEERPFCTERIEACWAQNRRAHFLVRQ
ncbi:MAG TPA: peptidoglycan-associated lipoprotein Pal [Methylomirabilota bacterium]|jgi:peptidoglycan-associated lipoprotein|nr:peptidoglycan-associated lipoprotein Pal [Methylomirabilota bacterium]